MKMGRSLAAHRGNGSGWTKDALEKDGVDFSGFTPARAAQDHKAEVLDQFDKSRRRRARRSGCRKRRFKMDGELDNALQRRSSEIFQCMPKVVVMRAFVFNHIVHHRAQLGVYLRLNEIPRSFHRLRPFRRRRTSSNFFFILIYNSCNPKGRSLQCDWPFDHPDSQARLSNRSGGGAN